jgi:uncharacterized protein YaiI (UPF0178 family)
LTVYAESVDYFILDVSYSDGEIVYIFASKTVKLKTPVFISRGGSYDAKNIEIFLKKYPAHILCRFVYRKISKKKRL